MRRWITIAVAMAVGMSLTAVAQAHHRSQEPFAPSMISTTHATDAIHAKPPTWGLDGRPGYWDIAFAPDGTLYAVDALNNRVYKVTSKGPWGQTTVVAGGGPGVNLKGPYFQQYALVKD